MGPKFEISTYDGIEEKSIRLDKGEIRQLIPVLQAYLERTEEKK